MGLAGFEPAAARVKVSCLTAWRQPLKTADKGIGPIPAGSEPAVLPLYESAKMTPGGIEPTISGLKGRCLMPLDYGARMRMTGFEPAVYGLKARCHAAWLHAQIQ